MHTEIYVTSLFILLFSIKSLERNIKTTQLSPLKIVQRTDNFIILEFKVSLILFKFMDIF